MRKLAIVGALSVLIAACGSASTVATPSVLPSISPSVLASPEQSTAAASAVPSPTEAVPSAEPTAAEPTSGPEVQYPNELNFANDFAMRVLVSGLNIRARPSTSGAKIGTAPKGSVYLVHDYRIQANGYAWYFGYQAGVNADGSVPTLPNGIGAMGVDPIAGWLAAGTSDTPYLQPIAPRCPTTVDLRNVQAMLSSETISCFGTKQIALKGTYGCGGCGGSNPGTFSPDWLASPLTFNFLSLDPSKGIGPFAVRFAPGGPVPPAEGSIISIHGHFNDSRASTCKIAFPPDNGTGTMVPLASAVAVAYCKAQFVVDSFDLLGTDPSFPS
jgi:hypothetical protein